MKRLILYIICFICLPLSASTYSKLLKNGDPETKYAAGLEYYNAKQYSKAIALLESVSTYYRGSEKAENILYILGNSYFLKKDYISSEHYLQTYTTTYLNGKHIVDCHYLLAEGYYKQSADPKLDQKETYLAIEKYHYFLSAYPTDARCKDMRSKLDELYEKLAERELNSAKLYYNLGNYRGNNYRAAITTAHNAMNEFPTSKYIEEFAAIIVRSKYKEAINSVHTKIYERSEDAWDECHYFLKEYPDSKYKKEILRYADHLYKIFSKNKK